MRAKRLWVRYLLLVMIFARPWLPAPARCSPARDTTIFSHVNLVSMISDRILADQTVVIQDGKIVEIGPSIQVRSPRDAVQIDGTGQYLMPGLADLHVHLFAQDDLLNYVTYGVTTVLNMDGGSQHLKWRQQVRDGKLLGPAIYTASHTIDGYPPLNEMFLTAENPSDAEALVRESKRDGYDFIKLYGTLRPDVFRSVLQTAAQEKIPVVGHINRQAGALEVLKSHQVLAAHLEDLLFARFNNPPTGGELEEFATAIAASHITVTPNLNINPMTIAQLKDLNAVLTSPDAELLPPAAYSQWLPANNRTERNDQTAQQIKMASGVQQMLYRMVTLLKSKGVRLVLGTDAAPYGFPGLSVHQELQELVDAGFTPYESLLTATRNAGNFIGEEIPGAPKFGTLVEGAQADLVLLSANPLLDIKNVKSIRGVMLKGRWLPLKDIEKLQTTAQMRYVPIRRRLQEIDAALENGDIVRARQSAQPLQTESQPWIAEWVLMTKARKLQSTNLPAAVQIARWSTDLYPSSFSAYLLLADMLFQSKDLRSAAREARKSQQFEPHNAATLNLLNKISSLQNPLKFEPAGKYEITYTNDSNGDAQKTVLLLESAREGQWRGTKTDPGGQSAPLSSCYVGGNRLWIKADTPMGPLEFRISVKGAILMGYWAGPFGRNGKLTGRRTHFHHPIEN